MYLSFIVTYICSLIFNAIQLYQVNEYGGSTTVHFIDNLVLVNLILNCLICLNLPVFIVFISHLKSVGTIRQLFMGANNLDNGQNQENSTISEETRSNLLNSGKMLSAEQKLTSQTL